MAISLAQVNTPLRNHVIGNRREICVDFTLDASYATGGYALTPKTLGVDLVFDFIQANSLGGYTYAYDYANQKLVVYSAGSEVSNATDLHTVTGRLVAHGKGPGL